MEREKEWYGERKMTEGRNKRKNGCKEEEKKREKRSKKRWRKGERRLGMNKDNHGIEEEIERKGIRQKDG
jgi:hypothetical protein